MDYTLVHCRKLEDKAQIPEYAKPGDAGLDLTAIHRTYDEQLGIITYHTGLAIQIPVGYAGLIFPRSSCYKYSTTQANCVGVIDSGYRGELLVKQRVLDFESPERWPRIGERVAQLVIVPVLTVKLQEVDRLEYSERSTDGFGSTGK